ncbi:MAG: 30S ribosomal protein S18 [bacterium]
MPQSDRPAGDYHRGPRPDRGPRPGGGRDYPSRPGADRQFAGGRRRPIRRFMRRKVCHFCASKATGIDYKDAKLLRRFVTERGKILPRRITGTCARHQRELTKTIKRARTIALLPFKSD